jgi:hypothetical protein
MRSLDLNDPVHPHTIWHSGNNDGLCKDSSCCRWTRCSLHGNVACCRMDLLVHICPDCAFFAPIAARLFTEQNGRDFSPAKAVTPG